ncbi:MAG: PAS domain-containing protein, partial [Bacteroidetes bacterium]|nr:PAS domain-containing protein [Bacteroidota bacterium]
MNISKQEIEVFGKAYTLINMSFFLISENFLIEYINDYALENIHLNHSYIGQKFNKLIGDNKLPPILDANELTHDPVIINNKMRKWDKLAIWIENKPFYILLDRAYDDSKATTYDNLVHDIENVIGHKFKKDLPLEQYLKEIGNYFTEIIKKVPCYIYWKNTNLEYIGCNDMVANLFHYKSTNEIFGKTDYDLSPERSLSESYRDDDKKIISEGKSLLNIPGKLKTPEGKVLDTLVSKVPIISLNGQVIGLVGITIDVTELNQARIAAEAGERAKDEIIANFSHDMRTPLSGIITTAYELKDDDISEEKRKELAVQLA